MLNNEHGILDNVQRTVTTARKEINACLLNRSISEYTFELKIALVIALTVPGTAYFHHGPQGTQGITSHHRKH